MINKRYKEFLPSLQASEELMDQVEMVSREMDALKVCIENEVSWLIYMPKQNVLKNRLFIRRHYNVHTRNVKYAFFLLS